MFIGVDLGTSGVKAILMSNSGKVLDSATEKLSISRPHSLWSEQDPKSWWTATKKSISRLSNTNSLQEVTAIGLAGQMHGVTLLDQHNRILRPAILWNDGRCSKECEELEKIVPESRSITGNIMMPGFSAPKLKWLAKHEPDCFQQVAKILLPKDYIRFLMTSNFASDMSDAAGTMWLNTRARDWSDDLLSACNLSRSHMPDLFEGCDITGTILPEVAQELGISKSAVVVAGGGDNAAGAVGVGVISPGDAMISLGTSGVYFSVSSHFMSNPERALHSFCHAIPNTWHTMSVTLSAASCLSWVARLTGYESVAVMMKELEQAAPTNDILFLPYLSGERTPHNNPRAKGVFFGMTHDTAAIDLVQAVVEGVSFALADGLDTLHATGEIPKEISLIGGGIRSRYWRQILSDAFGHDLFYREGGDVGPSLGAARLAKIAVSEKSLRSLNKVCPKPKLIERHSPNYRRHNQLMGKRAMFKELYSATSHLL